MLKYITVETSYSNHSRPSVIL